MSHIHAPALLASIVLFFPGSLLAQSSDVIQLPSVCATAALEAGGGFNPVQPPPVNKSSVPLSRTPHLITVVLRAVLYSQQGQTLADALHNVLGLVADRFRRCGWDDLIIRGHVASDTLFVDGLRTAAFNRVPGQLFGLGQVEVLKGPASSRYGLVPPGGLINMVSKRARPEAFANVETTVGSDDFHQGNLDMGTPLSEGGKAAFRFNALAMNSHDATGCVWFRNRWIAPSQPLDFGPRTDLRILTSYQERRNLRQQGLPVVGYVLENPNGSNSRDRFQTCRGTASI